MPNPSDDTTPITPPGDPADDTTAVVHAKGTGPQHAVSSDAPGIGRGGWWAITIAAAALLIAGFLLAFGPVRYWTPVPAVFLGYFLISGVIGLVFWKGVRELQNSDPNLRTDDPAPTGQRVAAAIGAVGIATAVILLPAGLSSAPANALPCPDGSNTCGPTAPTQDQPTQGNGGNTTAPQAPQTTIPPNADTGLPQAPTQGNGNGFQGTVQAMPTPDNTDPNSCILNCSPTQAQQAPQTGQATPPQTGQQQAPQTGQNPVTTAPQTVATTPQAPTSTPKLRTPTPETTTSSKQRDNDENQQRSNDENRDKNSGIPYQAAELSALAGTYRRRTTALSQTGARDAIEGTYQQFKANDFVGKWGEVAAFPDGNGGYRVTDPLASDVSHFSDRIMLDKPVESLSGTFPVVKDDGGNLVGTMAQATLNTNVDVRITGFQLTGTSIGPNSMPTATYSPIYEMRQGYTAINHPDYNLNQPVPVTFGKWEPTSLAQIAAKQAQYPWGNIKIPTATIPGTVTT